MSFSCFPYTESRLDELEALLFDSEIDEDSFDLFGIHGLICAFVISPEEVSLSEQIRHITGDDTRLSETKLELLRTAVSELTNHILAQVNAEQPIVLPAEIYEDEYALTNWCAGFIEGFLINEKAWFKDQDEPTVAGLLLPLMVHSDLFDDKDFEDIHNNDQLMAQMASELSDNLLDLYLLYRT